MALQGAMLIGTTFLDGKLMKVEGKKCFDPGIPPPRIKSMNLIRDVYGKAWAINPVQHRGVSSSNSVASRVQLFATPWTSLSITNLWSLLKLMSIELVMPSNYLILCCPLLFLPSIFPSIRVFSNWAFSLNSCLTAHTREEQIWLIFDLCLLLKPLHSVAFAMS